MVWIPPGAFRMGSAEFYPEEQPVHTVEVDGFWADEHPVTVAEFRRFIKDTGHVTFAEVAPDPADYPDADPDLLVPGSLVFTGTPGPVPLTDVRQWWSVDARCRLATSRGAGFFPQRSGAPSRSPTSPTPMSLPTPSGPARTCRARPSGSTQHTVGSTTTCTRGATTCRGSEPTACCVLPLGLARQVLAGPLGVGSDVGVGDVRWPDGGPGR